MQDKLLTYTMFDCNENLQCTKNTTFSVKQLFEVSYYDRLYNTFLTFSVIFIMIFQVITKSCFSLKKLSCALRINL